MTWDAIGALGEVFGAVVVMVSVIYLALQVKAARLQAEGSAHAEWFYSWNETIKGRTADESIIQTLLWTEIAPWWSEQSDDSPFATEFSPSNG